ncbi:helix-turn-helix transcriptional regulator [Hyphococcus formosus]|uniref:helix-turn-helix domain-containing protein n=1 Tax=Hyphococcus formosus TaxID=3143534 RepID=UPI00398AED8E
MWLFVVYQAAEMHPLKQYLIDVDEGIQAFSERVGVSRQTLYRIITRKQMPKPDLARRIVEATGGAVTLEVIYGGEGLRTGVYTRAEDVVLDHDRLKLAIAISVSHLWGERKNKLDDVALDPAAEAVRHIFAALCKISVRPEGPSLALAFLPVFNDLLGTEQEEIELAEETAKLAERLYQQ